MQKLAAFLFIFIMIFSFGEREALAKDIYSEKAWTVNLNLPALNNEENLSKVEVVDEITGEKVPIKIIVVGKVLEILPEEKLNENSTYKVTIKEGFESTNKMKTEKSFTEKFTVKGSFSKDELKGTWSSLYNNKGEVFDLNVIFNMGEASIKRILSDGNDYAYGDYNIVDGYMTMNVYNPILPGKLMLTLQGELNYFNETKVLIISKGGNLAYFNKINDRLEF